MTRLLVLILLIVIAVPLHAQDATPDVIPPALGQHLDSLVSVAEIVRGLDTLTPVERDFPTRQETIDYLTRLYDETISPEDFQRQAMFYGALDMLPDDIDLRDVYLTLLGAQVGGFYDPATQIMNVLPMGFRGEDNLSLTEQIIFVHEYTHALQDQHFDLETLTDASIAQANPDQALAITSLIEGDATIVMTVYEQEIALQNPMAAFVLLAESFSSGGLTLPEGTPGMLVRELTFPYEAGLGFVGSLYDAGGWEAINAAYVTLPQSTEQIIHPEKYLVGEAPIVVGGTPLTSLGMFDGWTSLYDVPLGEYYLTEHLRSALPPIEARAAAAGWGGDRFQMVTNPETGDRVWQLESLWDSVEDANEFVDAYVALGDAVFGEPIDSRGSIFRCWASDAETRCLMGVRAGVALDEIMTVVFSTTDPALVSNLIFAFTG